VNIGGIGDNNKVLVQDFLVLSIVLELLWCHS